MASSVLDDLDSLTLDGHVIHVRSLLPDDRGPLHALVDRCSDRSVYLRFFALRRTAAQDYVEELFGSGRDDAVTLVALADDEIVGVATYIPVAPTRGEMAVLVDDRHQGDGIGTVLLESLAAHARQAGLDEFVAYVLCENTAMLRVLHELGYLVDSVRTGSEEEIVWHLQPIPATAAGAAARDRTATVNSLRPLLAPSVVAVIGAGERDRSVGRSVFSRLLDGFAGRVYPVNPKRSTVLGHSCYPTVADLPEVPDLAVLAVPAPAVVDVARACGVRGVRGLLVLGSGFGETGPEGADREAELLAVVRDHGMRLVGPNCLGILNTDPDVRLRASLAELPDYPGSIGIAAQSGALGIAAVADLARHGVGVSQFVSLGNKADISGNDLLRWWDADEPTTAIGLYLESFGNPRNFRRVARSVTRRKPVVALKAGRSAAGLRAGSSHTAAAASPDDLVDALCAQSGVARVDTLEEFVAALRVLSGEPLPEGPRIAVIGNSGGPEILAADCAESHGLTVPVLPIATVNALRAAVPGAAAVTNPIDLGAEMTAENLRTTIAIALGCADIDAVAVIACETVSIGAAEIAQALQGLPRWGKPIVASVLGPDPVVEDASLPPVFPYPEVGVGALATAWQCARLRAATAEAPLPTTTSPHARSLVVGLPNGWLPAADAADLLAEYGVLIATQRTVGSVSAALRAAKELGLPLVAKADGIVHKTEVGGVRLDLRTRAEVTAAVTHLLTVAPRVVLQRHEGASAELLVGAVRVPQFGPAVVLAAGGVTTDVVADRAVRLAPLTTADAVHMMNSLRCKAIFDGFRGAAPVSRDAVRDLLLAVSRLMTEQPRVAEVDLNPVRCTGQRLVAVDIKVRLAVPEPVPDPYVRALSPRRAPHPSEETS